MNIEIKSIKINKAFSEETICFTADIFVNGIKTGYAKNDGHGGCTFYTSYHKPNNDEDLRQAEAYARSLPSTNHSFGGKTITLESNLESVIDEAIYDLWNNRENTKADRTLKKHMEIAICFGVPNSGRYSRIGYGKTPIRAVVMNNKQRVQDLVNRIKSELKTGEVILNTNLESMGLTL